MIEKLIYPTVTRPDIYYAVGLLNQFMHELRVVHWNGALRLRAYIKGTPHVHHRIMAYSNSSYAGDKGV